MRLDLALHGLRLFRSRTQAAAAIERGEVLLNSAPVKASRELHPGDRITIALPGATRTVEVLDLPRRGLSREQARALVREVG
jgi:ribosome-associated heat shock protein Hsp15